MATVTLDVLVEGVVKPMAFDGIVGGKCGSRYCQCQRFRGGREEAPVRKEKKAAAADPKGQRKRPVMFRRPVEA